MTTKLERALKRRRWRPQDAELVLAAFGSSDLTMAAFAQDHGVQFSRLRRWPARLSRLGRAEPAPRRADAAVSLLPVRVLDQGSPTPAACTPPPGPATLDVSVGAAVVHVPNAFDADHLRRVVQALAAPC